MKFLSFLLLVFIASGDVFGRQAIIYTDPFPVAYENASAIILAKVNYVEPSDKVILDLSKTRTIEHFKKVNLTIEKVWKGSIKKKNVINVYYLQPKGHATAEEGLGGMTLGIPDIPAGKENKEFFYIFFLKKFKGEYFTAERFRYNGTMRNPGIEKDVTYMALEKVSHGASPIEAMSILGKYEEDLYKRYLKQNEKQK